MVKKKKKGSKKKKSTKEKGPEEEKKNLYDIPEYIDPKIYTPKVELTIKLANPPVDHLSKSYYSNNRYLCSFQTYYLCDHKTRRHQEKDH